MSYVTKSPWVIHYDGSSCNGCDIEVLACLTPMYDVERFGIINTGNPKHADVFLVTGSVNEQNKNVVKQIYDQMPEPKVVVAVGICANNGGVFRECYNCLLYTSYDLLSSISWLLWNRGDDSGVRTGPDNYHALRAAVYLGAPIWPGGIRTGIGKTAGGRLLQVGTGSSRRILGISGRLVENDLHLY